MVYFLTAKDDVSVWNMFQTPYTIKKGEVVSATKSKINNKTVYTIVILGVPTLFDGGDVDKIFDIEGKADA